MVKTFVVQDISEIQARVIMETELPPLIRKLIRKAHKEGAKGRKARAEYSFQGPRSSTLQSSSATSSRTTSEHVLAVRCGR